MLVETRYGFRKGSPNDDAIFKLINEIVNTLNNKMKTGSVFFFAIYWEPLAQLLLDKLKYYGIKGKPKTLPESYLSNRYQTVQIS
jgi:protoheme ferro-lyase